ncbi:hypothetical protein CWI38_0828p0030 [Hamiltosporidium tvaerminnensis]|uniref:Uncharacterized protein n=2 Tax=Hamiltosporidium TaxID=1176354 RepID=A0A4Q9LD31_9MICR|nr:hypothetical protein CWI36_0564p0020 [Hamiltosporidium magnivora]TBU12258.1 hypothetical protein CWI38_0828p0030 [Hamiltosporidium tvaerminnensis]
MYFIDLLTASSTFAEQHNASLNIMRAEESTPINYSRPIPRKPKKKICENFLLERKSRIMNSSVKRKLDFDLNISQNIADSSYIDERTPKENINLENNSKKRAKADNDN